ncbi:MAG: PorT family protein [Flavipsychrobacter sp.]|nr:PorT family protein [Flavipsychrobacter sp.]
MKNTLCIIAAMICLLLTGKASAQDNKTDTGRFRKHDVISISNKGIRIEHTDSGAIAQKDSLRKENRKFSSSVLLFDLGVNFLQDNTNYTDPSVQSFLNVPTSKQNKNLFDLRTAKSINVNIYPFMERFRALKTPGQRIYISTGLGLQIYNFRYENPLAYTRNPASVTLSTTTFKKNKLSVNYLSIPLMLTFKTRLYKDPAGKTKNDEWLVYGIGITEGLRLNSWTKQKSDQFGKIKVHDQYGLADFNTCVSAEIGVEGIIRFFASYQLTSLYTNGMDQHPISIGIRLSGI